MPANQGLEFDDDQGLFPIAEARPEDKRETGRVMLTRVRRLEGIVSVPFEDQAETRTISD
jgi:hypothetical protein